MKRFAHQFKPGDKCRLTDEGIETCAKPSSRAEAQKILGVLTVAKSVPVPVNGYTGAAMLFFREIEDTVVSLDAVLVFAHGA